MFWKQLIINSNNLLKFDVNSIGKRYVQMGQKILVNGTDIHFERIGNGEHTVLLLPGTFGSTRTDFSPQLDGLNRDKFTLIAWDPPGYGYSRPPDRDFTDFYRRDAKMATKLMEILGFQRYSLMGWSAGGTTALIMAANNPKTVEKIIVFGTKAYLCEESLKRTEMLTNLKNWSPKVKQAFIDLYGEQLFSQMCQSFYAYYCNCFSYLGDICKSDLKNISQPCLILHGDNDPFIVEEHPLYLLKSIKNSRLYRFPKGRHNIHQTNVQEFNEMVEQFLLQDIRSHNS